ncbi:hypothetical protein BGZ76_005069 [Entomortierella beljakovae]|nr:hypothetical protein BGZ76_005069 [Entomortierella beljakovae]
MDQQYARNDNSSVAITIEKDSVANAHSRQKRQATQRSLGFKNIVIYILLFVNFVLCSKLYGIWSRSRDNNDDGYVRGSLVKTGGHGGEGEGEGGDASSPEFWIKMALIVGLVLIGGVFAGKYKNKEKNNAFHHDLVDQWIIIVRATKRLTIGLMGLDETNLQVLMVSGSPAEQAHAETVFKLLSRGKHWVLVTLLLGNVIVNETLPVVLDSELGGGITAILISTLLIVVFGEIIPQAVCARHGLAIGAYCAKPMLVLMYLFSPAAYPIAKLLDSWLGVHHGTTYRRTELKTLVSLHQMDGIGELTDDEVTIIASVLDLKDKPVSSVMTPLEDVFTLSEDAILDEKLMEEIVTAGYSRIPIYRHDDHHNFIGMLLVKRLITYDPEDHIPVRQFTINSLPEAAPNTSCLDILNFFQEGRSHMAIVTSDPGGFGLPVGVITLEDVIEELLGEEIVDESDVYVDIKVIRKPSRNVNMIKNLKSLLRSPGISGANETTPLLANVTTNGRRVSMPIDNKSFATGKTILQPQQSASDLIEPIATISKQKSNPVQVIEAGPLLKDIHNAKGDHSVQFKDNVEAIKPKELKPTTETTSSSSEAEERTLTVHVPEANSTYPINPPQAVVTAGENVVTVEEEESPVPASPAVETPAPVSPIAEPPIEPTNQEAESSSARRQLTESESTSTLLSNADNANASSSSSPKKKKKKKSKK